MPAKQQLNLFVKDLKSSGFVKMNNDKFPVTRIYNKHTESNHSKDILEDKLSEYIETNNLVEKLGNEVVDDMYSGVIGYSFRSLPLVIGTTFEPSPSPIIRCGLSGLKYVNTYKTYTLAPTVSNEVSPLWFEYLERLFPDPDERHIALQWLSHMFQKPLQRPSWHLMLSSVAGTGKGFLVENILNPLLSGQSYSLRKFSQLMGQFSGCLENNMLILLDDTKSKSSTTQTELKSVLSEERQYIEKKGEQGRMKKTYARIILASNEIRPLQLDEDERRWFATSRLVHKVSPEDTQQFISQLANWLSKPSSLDSLYSWFMQYNLTGFNYKRIDQTTTIKQMIEQSKSVGEEVAIEWANTKRVFTDAQLKEEFGREKDLAKSYLLEAGWKKSTAILKDGARRNAYISDGMTQKDAGIILAGGFPELDLIPLCIPAESSVDSAPF